MIMLTHYVNDVSSFKSALQDNKKSTRSFTIKNTLFQAEQTKNLFCVCLTSYNHCNSQKKTCQADKGITMISCTGNLCWKLSGAEHIEASRLPTPPTDKLSCMLQYYKFTTSSESLTSQTTYNTQDYA